MSKNSEQKEEEIKRRSIYSSNRSTEVKLTMKQDSDDRSEKKK